MVKSFLPSHILFLHRDLSKVNEEMYLLCQKIFESLGQYTLVFLPVLVRVLKINIVMVLTFLFCIKIYNK